ncbi:NAD kinase [Novosphingopyxis sp. YJ-S2-01]|uniref:NAD kinase n=1 Tax=Novosphingopyxis sp. YJ-S2-01 TaxID=2794021 RepID=UPI0018DC1A16|nr:NAD kinase [Novosphingopyxis sp. YJ-S2-01]MBH9537927.1 NAD kinase [Novosphingopyxis sp. YJ-S2-01]
MIEGTALLASPTRMAREAREELLGRYEFVDLEDAARVVVLGGDGYMLQVLHQMLENGRLKPVFGMNRGTVGFLLNSWRSDDLSDRLAKAKSFSVAPLRMSVTSASGETRILPAINEVSLLRETRQTAKIEVRIDDRVTIDEMVCDGVLVATPAGSTAYNMSANGPILPLGSAMLALTPISPFRPRRWKGAILPDRSRISFRILNADKRPVSAVADQREVRDITRVDIEIDRSRQLTLLFDPEHALDERIAMEQFAT